MILGDRISEALRGDITIASGTFALRASIGVACTTGVDGDADTLVGEADAAMYESKRQSAGRPVLFHPALRMAASETTKAG